MGYVAWLQRFKNHLSGLKLADVGRGFFYAFVAVLPLQIKALIFTKGFYETGFFNPYLSHFLYLEDIFLIFALMFFGLHLVFGRGTADARRVRAGGNFYLTVLLGFFLAVYIFSLLVSVNKANTLFYIVRYFEFFIVYLLISSEVVKIRKVVFVFLGAMFLVTFIGVLQYISQRSLGLGFLGEPVVSATLRGVAKVNLFDGAVLRAYSTFPHPNLFAGYLVFAIFFCLYYWKKYKSLFTFLLVVFGAGLILTFSRSAILALFAGVSVYYFLAGARVSFRYILLGVVCVLLFILVFDLTSILSQRFIFGDSASLTERGVFYAAGEEMFLENPFGVGAGNFTEAMQNYVGNKLMPWQFQPVHNIFVLLLNEIGIVGLITAVSLFIYAAYALLRNVGKKALTGREKKSAMLAALLLTIFVIGLFDHYFVSLYQGQALLFMFFGIVGRVTGTAA